MSLNVKPLADRVIVEPGNEETTAGGIIIPDTASPRVKLLPQEAVKDEPVTVKKVI